MPGVVEDYLKAERTAVAYAAQYGVPADSSAKTFRTIHRAILEDGPNERMKETAARIAYDIATDHFDTKHAAEQRRVGMEPDRIQQGYEAGIAAMNTDLEKRWKNGLEEFSLNWQRHAVHVVALNFSKSIARPDEALDPAFTLGNRVAVREWSHSLNHALRQQQAHQLAVSVGMKA